MKEVVFDANTCAGDDERLGEDDVVSSDDEEAWPGECAPGDSIVQVSTSKGSDNALEDLVVSKAIEEASKEEGGTLVAKSQAQMVWASLAPEAQEAIREAGRLVCNIGEEGKH